MNETFCDRCKKSLGSFKTEQISTLTIKDIQEDSDKEKINYNKTLCPSCAINFIDIIDIECDKYI